MVSQHKLVSGWGLWKWRSVPPFDLSGSGRTLRYLRTMISKCQWNNKLVNTSSAPLASHHVLAQCTLTVCQSMNLHVHMYILCASYLTPDNGLIRHVSHAGHWSNCTTNTFCIQLEIRKCLLRPWHYCDKHKHVDTQTHRPRQNTDRRGTQTLHNVGMLVVEVIEGDGNFFHDIRPLIVSYNNTNTIQYSTISPTCTVRQIAVHLMTTGVTEWTVFVKLCPPKYVEPYVAEMTNNSRQHRQFN